MTRIVWRGRQVCDAVADTVDAKLHVVGGLMVRDIKNDIKKPGPTRTHPGYAPSKPGESPHVRTRRLWQSITHEVEKGVCRVGTNVKYAKWLELGTRNMRPRPFLRKALSRARASIVRILRG